MILQIGKKEYNMQIIIGNFESIRFKLTPSYFINAIFTCAHYTMLIPISVNAVTEMWRLFNMPI